MQIQTPPASAPTSAQPTLAQFTASQSTSTQSAFTPAAQPQTVHALPTSPALALTLTSTTEQTNRQPELVSSTPTTDKPTKVGACGLATSKPTGAAIVTLSPSKDGALGLGSTANEKNREDAKKKGKAREELLLASISLDLGGVGSNDAEEGSKSLKNATKNGSVAGGINRSAAPISCGGNHPSNCPPPPLTAFVATNGPKTNTITNANTDAGPESEIGKAAPSSKVGALSTDVADH